MQRYILLILIIVVVAGGGYFFLKNSGYLGISQPNISASRSSLSPTQSNKPPPRDLIEREWVWLETTFPDGNTTEPNGDKQFILQFSPDGKINAQTDCNTFIGSYYQAVENSVTISATASTRIACRDEPVQEAEFIESLNRTKSYSVEGNELHLVLTDSSTMTFE